MRILELLTHGRHYWGVPHRRAADGCLIMTCYECGREQKVHGELRSSLERIGIATRSSHIAA
jgi:hypothetical protein